jgi:hypothetical protein
MSLGDLAALGSFVSGVAVLVSLIFLYYQLRQISEQMKQAEKHQRAAIGQGRVNRMVELSLRTVETEFGVAMANVLTNSEKLTAHELFQFLHYTRALFLNAEDTYYQHESGLLEDEQFAGFVNALKYSLSAPAVRMMWFGVRVGYGPKFASFVDKLIQETPLDPPTVPEQQLSSWNAGMAAILASMQPAKV